MNPTSPHPNAQPIPIGSYASRAEGTLKPMVKLYLNLSTLKLLT
ncbi:MAG: hypothetical protein QXU47_04295 [Candidatus Bathyarchaeia archaeon]